MRAFPLFPTCFPRLFPFLPTKALLLLKDFGVAWSPSFVTSGYGGWLSPSLPWPQPQCSQPAGGPGMQHSPSLDPRTSTWSLGIPPSDIQSMFRVKSNKLVWRQGKQVAVVLVHYTECVKGEELQGKGPCKLRDFFSLTWENQRKAKISVLILASQVPILPLLNKCAEMWGGKWLTSVRELWNALNKRE